MFRSTKRRLLSTSAIVATSALLLVGCSGSDGDSSKEGLEDATLMLGVAFTPRHAPVFAAYDQGFFEDEGINLEIMPGTGSGNTVAAVDTGKVEFGWADFGVTVLDIAAGSSVKQVNLLQGSDFYSVLALEGSGINDWDDLKGKTVATEATGAMTAMWPIVEERMGFKEGDVKLIHANGDAKVPGLLSGKWDANLAYSASDAPGLIDQGEDPVILPWSDADLSIYGDGVLTSEKLLEDNPELVKSFNRAITKGFMWACSNTDETIKSFNNQVEGFSDIALETAIEMQCDGRWNDENESVGLGYMSDEGVQQIIDLAGEYLGLEDPDSVSPSDIYTNDFVEPIKPEEEIDSSKSE
ncbi:MAG: ABC transporter substrate-binding protein [Canibacter sp.]